MEPIILTVTTEQIPTAVLAQTRWHYEPKPDVTAYEATLLAVVLVTVATASQPMDQVFDWLKKKSGSDAILRHFRKGE